MYSDIQKALLHRKKKLIKQWEDKELEIVTEELDKLEHILWDHE